MKIVLIIFVLFITLAIYSCNDVINQKGSVINTMNIINYNILDKKEKRSFQDSEETIRKKVNLEQLRDEYKNQQVLSEIKESAAKGMVIDCEFKAKYNNIESVIRELGQADECTYIEDAKGQYYVYAEDELVFGVNKGMQIFEVRTFDNKINSISLKDVQNYYGVPDYEIINELNEQIIGYVINEDFKILLVFSRNSQEGNLILNHYSVLYPMGTANWMAENGDPREW